MEIKLETELLLWLHWSLIIWHDPILPNDVPAVWVSLVMITGIWIWAYRIVGGNIIIVPVPEESTFALVWKIKNCTIDTRRFDGVVCPVLLRIKPAGGVLP